MASAHGKKDFFKITTTPTSHTDLAPVDSKKNIASNHRKINIDILITIQNKNTRLSNSFFKVIDTYRVFQRACCVTTVTIEKQRKQSVITYLNVGEVLNSMLRAASYE